VERSIRVAVVGCGWAGARHARAFARLGVEVRWAVDTDRGRAEAVAAELGGARVAADHRGALRDPDLDAVSICLPHHLHAPVAAAAAAAGKHVLCEKPLAGTLEEADRMIGAAERAGATLMVAENVRFDPLLRRVRDLLRDGVIGRVVLIRLTRQADLARSLQEERPWFLDARAAAGGIMMSGGIHDVETMRMLLGEVDGEVDTVYALRVPQRFVEMEGDDTSVATLRFRNGAVGVLTESFVAKSLATATGVEIRTLHVDGDLGSLVVDGGQVIRLFSERADLRVGMSPTQHEIYVPPQDTFALEIEHFLESIRAGSEPVTSGRSQRKPLEVVLAAYRSMDVGHPVKVAEPRTDPQAEARPES
jgi:predicted dehydrogenase